MFIFYSITQLFSDLSDLIRLNYFMKLQIQNERSYYPSSFCEFFQHSILDSFFQLFSGNYQDIVHSSTLKMNLLNI